MQTDMFRATEEILPAALADVWVTVERRPVLSRETDKSGYLINTEQSMHRTAQALEERLVKVVRWTRASRVGVVLGTEVVDFSVKTGRAVRHPDWRVTRRSCQRLRVLQKKHFTGKEE